MPLARLGAAVPVDDARRERLPAALQGLSVEDLLYRSEEGSPQGWVPLRLAKLPQQPSRGAGAAGGEHRPQQQQREGQRLGQREGQRGAASAAGQQRRLPVALLLHATGASRDALADQQAALARAGYLAAAIDCRYHGGRSAGASAGTGAAAGSPLAQEQEGPPAARQAPAPGAAREGYERALVAAWRGSGERPFLLDTVWDVLRLLDYLETRPDVDTARIGCTGVSLGGMHTWLAAAADPRIAVAAPMIGVQWFGWAVENNSYHGRVESIPQVFAAAAEDLRASGITPRVVAAVWDRLLPGARARLLTKYDAPWSLPLIAPRPLLICTGELEPRCPMQAGGKAERCRPLGWGVAPAVERAREAYAAAGAESNLRLFVEPGVGHVCTEAMWRETHAWLDAHLLPGRQRS
eukprot:scaffold10.g2427.t1